MVSLSSLGSPSITTTIIMFAPVYSATQNVAGEEGMNVEETGNPV